MALSEYNTVFLHHARAVEPQKSSKEVSWDGKDVQSNSLFEHETMASLVDQPCHDMGGRKDR